MGLWLKQSTAVDVLIGPFVDSTDGNTTEEALTIEDEHVLLSKLGQALAAKNDANNATHDDLGYYNCPLNATDTNTLGALQLCCHMAGALPVYHEFMVVTAHVYDSMCGSDYQQVDIIQVAGVAEDIATETKQDIIDGNVDSILTDTGTTLQTDITAIKNKTDNLPADPASETNVDANETKIDTLTTAVSAIQNNTRFTAAVPSYLTKPDAGNEAFRISCNLYDTDGNMEDPENAEVMVRVIQDDGSFITANLYKENALSNNLDNPTNTDDFAVASGWKAMEKEATGKYFLFYKVANDETEESLTVEFGWEETTDVLTYQSRATQVTDVHGDLSAILTATTAIQAKTDLIGASVAPASEYDTQLDQNLSDTQTAITDAISALNNIDADAVWDEIMDTNAPANMNSAREIMNVTASVVAGKSSGGGTNTIIYRDTGDTKNRVSATVDANGNRTAVGTADGT